MPTPNPTTRREFKGAAAASNLSVGIAAGDMSFTLVASNNWPTGSVGNFVVAIDRGQPPEEKILCSAQSGHVVTVAASGRGFDGTTAQSHAANATVECVISAFDADEWNQHTNATSGVHGASGTVMGKQLFTAKGDQLVGTAAGSAAAVPVGADGTVWTADSTQASGTKWAAGGVDSSPWTAYTPIGATGGVAYTFAGGDLTGAYKALGKTLHFRIRMNNGPTGGGAAGQWTFSLPVGVTAAADQPFSGVFIMSSPGAGYNGEQYINQLIVAGANTFGLIALSSSGLALVADTNNLHQAFFTGAIEIA